MTDFTASRMVKEIFLWQARLLRRSSCVEGVTGEGVPARSARARSLGQVHPVPLKIAVAVRGSRLTIFLTDE
jgi:hypothetical protein